MVPVISRSQRRKIQRRYTQYQRDLKESGESSSMIQTGEKKNRKSDHSSKPVTQNEVDRSREQLVKVHSELKAREKESLTGLEKALMESGSETEEDVGVSQKKEMVEEEMFEAFMAEQTFLVGKPAEENHSKGPVSNEIPECIMQDVSEEIDQGDQEGKQVQPAIQFGSFPPVSVNMVHILPQEFQAGDENQEG